MKDEKSESKEESTEAGKIGSKRNPRPSGIFYAQGVKIVIYPKEGESSDDAIARVAKAHSIDPIKVKKFND